MNEQVLTITASAAAESFVISTPAFRSEPSMISASTRFLAQPSEISPTRSGALDGGVDIQEAKKLGEPRGLWQCSNQALSAWASGAAAFRRSFPWAADRGQGRAPS